MFPVGSLVVYGNAGVCRVRSVSHPDMDGIDENALYYELEPVYHGGTIFTPVDQNRIVIREPITREEAQALLDGIGSLQLIDCKGADRHQLSTAYADALDSHDCEQMLRLLLTISHRREAALAHKRKPGQMDERVLRQVEDLLYGELAVALEIDKSKVPALVASAILTAEIKRKKRTETAE